MNILMVMSDEERAAFLCSALEAKRHRVARVATPAQALSVVGQAVPEAIVFGVDAGLDGFRSSLEPRMTRSAVPVLPTGPDDQVDKLISALDRLERARVKPPLDEGPRTILLVDDRETNRQRLVSQFGGHGWKVIEAGDDRAAALHILDDNIDCLMVSAVLGGRTRYGVVRSAAEIRKVHPNPYAILVVADAEDSDTAARMIENGADDVVGRTIGASVLRRRLEAALNLRDLLRENRWLKERIAALEAERD